MKKSFSIKPGLTTPVQSTADRPGSREFITQLKKMLRTHALFITLIVCSAAACQIVAQLFDTADSISLSLYSMNWKVMFCSLIAFFVGHAIYIMIFVRPDRLTKHILKDLRYNYLHLERIMTGLLILLFMPVFMSPSLLLKP